MGRPRGGRNTAMVNGRITAEQMAWLDERGEELGGNLSAALRQAITDARLLEVARGEWRALKAAGLPPLEPSEDGAETSVLAMILSWDVRDVEDVELRGEERGEAR